MAAGQLFAVNSLGGFTSAKNLSKELRMGVQAVAKFRQFADVRDAWGKVTRAGQTFTWDVVPMMSRANRALAETNTIPSGQHTYIQATLTMSERGFSVPYSEALESLAEVSVRAPIMKVLKYDAACDIDCLVHAEFNKTPMRVAATATADGVTLTTNSTATLTVSQKLSLTNAKSIIDKMKGRNVPYYTDSEYAAVARPEGLRALKNDIEAIHQYTETGLEYIMKGEVGRIAGECRIVEQTVVPAGGAADSTTFDAFTDTADAWNAAAAPDWAFFFGADTVCEAVHTQEEIRAKIPDDYGRSKGIAWYALIGYGITHNSSSSLANARIFKFDSAV
jgi:N4-gp56 family major capsid protein